MTTIKSLITPKVSNLDEDMGHLKFVLSGVNVSIANSLRRSILAEIPCIVFKTIPYEDSKINIKKNTTRFNNEIIKQRLSCIPIHIDDMDFPIGDYVIEIDKINEGDNIVYITTEDFKIKNNKLNNYLNESQTRKIFPKNDLTNQYIDFIRLHPKITDTVDGEQLTLSCDLAIGTAKEQGMFNVVASCSYNYTQDMGRIEEEWTKYINDKLSKQNNTEGSKIDKAELEFRKKDWMLLDAKKICITDSFDFNIETIGIYTNFQLVELGCKIIINKLRKLSITLKNTDDIISESENTMDNCYDIRLDGEDYTIGKLIEYFMYYKYFIGNDDKDKDKILLSYCGFIKQHPHHTYSIIRLAFNQLTDNQMIIQYLESSIRDAISVYEKIKDNFIIE